MEQTTNYCTLTDTEILAIISKAINEASIEEKQARRRARIREAKADFFNLDATEYCRFAPAE